MKNSFYDINSKENKDENKFIKENFWTEKFGPKIWTKVKKIWTRILKIFVKIGPIFCKFLDSKLKVFCLFKLRFSRMKNSFCDINLKRNKNKSNILLSENFC